ncbi:MAG: hypothetical protein UV76_C0010G0027 [Candidatus Nomurabacteria bacterium GW2011_GWA2_43_15]|uniref:DoxX family protein n=1 Tax=Candidatus Nomurabacteria bacterium GW2011_GWA2_43_15 TaxID=1618738 RepID=A0A0G1FZP6_9BACT|nr:MAG: hypothetical protein UV76_C0010G0027 [Candidatus Nomurabacteria bacterium GW2011_GWA2_43_15]
MNKTSFHILRVGLAITFLWIGILIFKQPEAWGGYLQPWVTDLLPIPIKEAMLGTAFLDIVIGILLLVDSFTWLAALLGTLHLIVVISTSGINEVIVRDIGLLAATAALFWDSLPKDFMDKIRLFKYKKIVDNNKSDFSLN